MDVLFQNLCRTPEIALREASFGDNIVELLEPQDGICMGSFYVSIRDDELYAKLKKHIRAYRFRESLLSGRNISTVIETQSCKADGIGSYTTFYIKHFPPQSDDMYIDFVEEEKVNEHIAALK
ncbi:MAG: hypothetical protein V1734_07085 [Nanoarchaeota archaeon]